MEQLLFTVYPDSDLSFLIDKAEKLQCGLEIHSFVHPAVLTADLEARLASYRQRLQGFRGPLGFHGAFYDMMSASVDPDVVELTRRRYRQNVAIAASLKGQYVVFHANYMGSFKLSNYRPGWHRRQVDFWRSFVEEVEAEGVDILLENMWADDPTIIADILAEVDHPRLRACLDISHAVLYSAIPPQRWIEVLQPYLYCCHLNNTDGHLDLHRPLHDGVIDYGPVLAALRQLSSMPLLTLEMPTWPSIERSLQHFRLNGNSDGASRPATS
jgi:sugar phosphate isomerase/epimerase